MTATRPAMAADVNNGPSAPSLHCADGPAVAVPSWCLSVASGLAKAGSPGCSTRTPGPLSPGAWPTGCWRRPLPCRHFVVTSDDEVVAFARKPRRRWWPIPAASTGRRTPDMTPRPTRAADASHRRPCRYRAPDAVRLGRRLRRRDDRARPPRHRHERHGDSCTPRSSSSRTAKGRASVTNTKRRGGSRVACC